MRNLERAAGGLSLVGGLVHVAAGPEHFSEWWGYGLFFFAAALCQAILGLLLLTRGVEARGGWPAWRGRVCWAGILGNAALIGMWVVSRTVGIPLGPGAGEVEAVGVLDLTAEAVELASIALLATLLVLHRRARRATA